MVNPQKKGTITPDVMLDTKNVMIPVVKPVPGKQNFNVPLSKNRPQILRATNYKNNPALLFTETPSHVLYDPLRNLLEVKRLNNMRFKNQSTKYTISKKTNSVSMKRSSISQNLCLSKKLSNYGKTNCTLYFPNTIPVRLEVSTKDLKKASLKSIKLSRKCNLPQIKHISAKYKDKFAIMPKIETQISDNVSQTPNISFSSQSFYNTTDTASETSVSVPSFRKEAFVNTQDREKSMSRIASNQLQSINSECEINVLHYENDAPSEDCIAHLLQHHLKSIKTNSSISNANSAKIQDNDNDIIDEKNKMKNYREWNVKIPDIKYSWEIDSWMPFSQRKEYNDIHEIKNIDMTYRKKPYECKIKYSWQVIGISTQTSHSLLQDLMDNIDVDKSAYKMCSIKYSWQIIGISTQASLDDHNDPNYWEGVLLSPNKNCDNLQIDNNETDCIKLRDHRIKCKERGLRRYLILNNQETQTFAEKEAQTDINDYYMEQILEALTNQNLSDKLEMEYLDSHDKLLETYTIEPLMPNIPNKNSVISGNNGNENTKSEELLTKLMYTLKKFNQYERNLDKTWDTNLSRLVAKDSFPQTTEASTVNMEETITGIIQSTREYIEKLDYQLKDLDNADQQIENNMMRTLKDIDGTFQSLLDDVCHEINKRREQLILEADIHKYENLIPLRACRKEVEAQIQNAQNVISMSEDMLQRPCQRNANIYAKIIAASNDIGRIPAVPYSDEIPSINFDRPSSLYKEEIIEQISKFGYISRTIPVQIINIEERPAGLFVKWHITNSEYTAEEQMFIVEKANGEILDPTSSEFEIVYKGSETFCFIRNIEINQPVTLRVRIQADSIASVHHIARTTILPYSWETNNKDYMITNNGKIAAKLTDIISTLFSQSPQFDANHIIEFKFLEVSQEGNDDEGIALVYNPQGSNDTLKRTASLMITPRGKIFMDGDEKLMRLPRMRFGTSITISAFQKNARVLRLNIESENKCVTYDWRVQTPLYFAARFMEYKKWNLMIK